MKLNIYLVYFIFFTWRLTAQNIENHFDTNEGSNLFEGNDANHPCISFEQYQTLEMRCNQNAALYIAPNSITRGINNVALSWPLKAATGFADCSYYYISAHVDHDTSATLYKDYNCGTNCYNGHKGTDIAIGPFPFYKLDNNQVEVIAAAAGTIIDKHDGEYDRNCVGVGSNLTANYVALQHADGSRTLYLHMKSGKVIAKAIGQTVAAGEVLGIVGSSGSSSGPHLHFEVWAGSTVGTLVDPFSGSCNKLNATSWWGSQKPYTEPSALKVSTNTTDIPTSSCPNTEITNETDSFVIPFQGVGLTAGYAKFYLFLRNETNGMLSTFNILNPNGSVFLTWTYNSTTNNNFSYRGFSKKLPTIPGKYTFQATYNGVTCSKDFTIVVKPTAIIDNSAKFQSIQAYPNPSNSCIVFQFNEMITDGELLVFNEWGQTVKVIHANLTESIKMNRDNLPNGIYFVHLKQGNQRVAKAKFALID